MIQELLIQTSIYAFIFFGVIFLMNVYTKGFLFKYIRCRMNLENKALVKVHCDTDPYVAVATFKGGRWQYKQKGSKQTSSIILDGKTKFQRFLRVNFIEIRESDGAVFVPYEGVINGVDPERADNLIVRTAMLSKLKNTQLVIITILVIVVIAMLGYNIYLDMSIQDTVAAMQTAQQLAEGVVPVQ